MTLIHYEKRYTSTAHHYARSDWTAEKNAKTFGSKYSVDGMGHNLAISAGLRVSDNLSHCIGLFESIVKSLDHKNLNKDLLYFLTKVPTVEQIALYVFMESKRLIGDPVCTVQVLEGQDLWSEVFFDSKNELKTSLSKKTSVQCIYNKEIQGLKKTLGHEYEIEVVLQGEINKETGMIFPHDEFDDVLNKEVIRPFQGALLNEFIEDVSPESFANHLKKKLYRFFPDGLLKRVLVRENKNNSVSV